MQRSEGFQGSQAELYLLLADVGESQQVHEAVVSGAAILELGCGTGRMTRALLDLGHSVTGVDNDAEMLSHVPRTAEPVLGDIETLNLATTYPVVLLASNLINSPDRTVRSKLLATCRRHVSNDGLVILQRYQPELQGWDSKCHSSTVISLSLSRHIEAGLRGSFRGLCPSGPRSARVE